MKVWISGRHWRGFVLLSGSTLVLLEVLSGCGKKGEDHGGKPHPAVVTPVQVPFAPCITVTITPGSASQPPAADPPACAIYPGQSVKWACPSCGSGLWVVVFDEASAIPASGLFTNGDKIFNQGYPTGTLDPNLKLIGPIVVKYKVATQFGIIDPHIVPMSPGP